jgi:hypothetical protein
VGKYVNDFFVSSFQKIASFVIANQQKQGGNVASYFCTADGRVLHVIAGPVDAAVFLQEARWVVETWKLAQLEAQEDPLRFQTVIRKAHADRLRQEYHISRLPSPRYAAVAPKVLSLPAIAASAKQRLGIQGKVHVLLATYPMPRLEQVYVLVFERILNQRLSTIPVVNKG